MTMPGQILAGAARSPAGRTVWRDELIETIRLAFPIALTQLAQLEGERMLLALGQTPVEAALAAEYLRGLAWCLVPAWWFIALRGFMQSVDWPEPGLWITLAAIPINALLAYALIYGEFGLPRLEMLG